MTDCIQSISPGNGHAPVEGFGECWWRRPYLWGGCAPAVTGKEGPWEQ